MSLKKLALLSLLGLGALSLVSVQPVVADLLVQDSLRLEPEPKHNKEAFTIASLLNHYHYRKTDIDDSLSSAILDRYLKSLDYNKVYFLQSDISAFERYRSRLDNDLQKGNLDAPYSIFNVFAERFFDRMDFIQQTIDEGFDFSIDEFYETDREKQAYARNFDDLNEQWRKLLKAQALNLVLTGKDYEAVKDILKKRYDRLQNVIKKYKSEDVFEIYMNAVSESFDPHTTYFSPASYDNFNIDISQSLEGIGARLMTEGEYTKVSEVITGGPAFKSKELQKNDRIIGVGQGADGPIQDVVGWRIDEVVEKIRGPKGTTVRLEILRAKEGANAVPKIITLVREKIKLEERTASSKVVPVTVDGVEMKFGLINIPSFYYDVRSAREGDEDFQSTTSDVKRLIQELETEGIEGLMIDLRYNGGGSLTEAINLTGLFIDQGPVVQIKESSGKLEVMKDSDRGVAYDGPLAVMINRFSASASEIFAGAIQDYQRGIVLGEQSYGKGTVQSLLDLARFINDEEERLGQVKITLAKFYRVTGSSTQHKGVNPDVAFPSAYSADEFGESSEASALPWDRIRPTPYEKVKLINPQIVEKLNQNFSYRLAHDADLMQLANEVEELNRTQANTLISLNKTAREKEREASEARTASPPSVDESLDPEVPGQHQFTIEEDDPYMKEGIRLLYELASLVG